jgi:cytoskeleton protein RodZ
MSNASRLTDLQDRLAARETRLHINEIVEDAPVPEYDSVGLELRAHRERKGHELDMAARVLRIKAAHISAIEESRYADLPGKTYAIGFVRAYAEYLGLNPDDCIRRFKREYAEALEPQAEEGARKDKQKLAFPEAYEEVRLPHGSLIIIGALLILGVWGGWYLTTSAERQFDDAETVALPPSEVPTPQDADAVMAAATEQVASDDGAEAATFAAGEEAGDAGPATHAEQMVAALTGTGQETVTTEDVGATGDEALVATETETLDTEVDIATQNARREPQVFGVMNNSARVIVRARGNAWVRVEDAGGAVLFEETMQRGDSYRVPNQAGVIMATRNAGALELLLDGQSLGPAGAVGEARPDVALDAAVLQGGRP